MTRLHARRSGIVAAVLLVLACDGGGRQDPPPPEDELPHLGVGALGRVVEVQAAGRALVIEQRGFGSVPAAGTLAGEVEQALAVDFQGCWGGPSASADIDVHLGHRPALPRERRVTCSTRAGGGGRGRRSVESPEDVPHCFTPSRSYLTTKKSAPPALPFPPIAPVVLPAT